MWSQSDGEAGQSGRDLCRKWSRGLGVLVALVFRRRWSDIVERTKILIPIVAQLAAELEAERPAS